MGNRAGGRTGRPGTCERKRIFDTLSFWTLARAILEVASAPGAGRLPRVVRRSIAWDGGRDDWDTPDE